MVGVKTFERFTVGSFVTLKYCNLLFIGKGGKNPVSELTTFYLPPKAGSNGSMIVGLAPSESVSRLLPREFEEIYLRIYCKHKAHLPVIKAAFEQVRSQEHLFLCSKLYYNCGVCCIILIVV